MRDNVWVAIRIAIVGGGISGLATAVGLRRHRPDWTVEVYEREPTPGGKVRTTTRDGYTFEWGPNGFLTGVTETLDLAVSLGLSDALLPAADASRRRYLFRNGGLRELPSKPPAFLATELLTVPGKIRAALEPALASRSADEESVFAFVERHFGREAADALAEPLVVGITGGDPHELSLDALFPRLRDLEAEHRSVILGMIRSQLAQRAQRRERNDTREPVAPTDRERIHGAQSAATSLGGRLTTFSDGGTQRLIDELARALGDAVKCGVTVAALEPGPGGGTRLHLERGRRRSGHEAADPGHGSPAPTSVSDSVDVDGVVLAAPSYAAAAMLRDWQPDAAALLDQIPFAPIGVVGLGFDRVDVPRVLDGFGFLAPSGQGLRSLGVLWSSTMFPDQAPDGKVLLRILAGGRRDPGFVELDRSAAVDAVMADLALSMGVKADPKFAEHIRWSRAIPQYTLGHAACVANVEALLAQAEGNVFLTGNSYRGVGLNDCVRDANRAVITIVDRMSNASAT